MDVNTVWQNLWHTDTGDPADTVIGKLKQKDFVAEYTCKPVANPWVDWATTAFHSKGSYDRHWSGTPIRYKNDDKRAGFAS